MINITKKNVPHEYRNKYLKNKSGTVNVSYAPANAGGGGGQSIDVVKSDSAIIPTDSNVYSSLRTLFEIRSRIIANGDDTELTDNNTLSSLRTLQEVDDAIAEALNVYSEAIKNQYLSRLSPDQTLHLLKLLGGAEIGETIDSFLAGKGIVLKDGRIQADTIEVRNSLKVMELIINEINAMSGDYAFSDTGKIEHVEELGNNTYRLWMDKRTSTDWTTLSDDDVMYSIINNLRTGGTDYYTSWVRCLAKNINDNTLTVVMYPDSEVPGGTNYAPAAGYNLTRRGNANAPLDGSHNSRQDSWLLSSNEGAILFLQNVYKPMLDEHNYALAIGKLPKLKMFENLPIGEDDMCLYGKNVIAQNYYKIDFNGNISASEVSRGEWSASVAVSDSPYRRVVNVVETPNGSKVNVMEVHTVYNLGCKWACLIDKTTDEPKWNAPGWKFIEGDNKYYISFDSDEGFQFFYGMVKATIRASVFFGNINITAELLAAPGSDIQWTRNSENVPDDNAWIPTIDGAKNRLKLVDEDMGRDWLSRRKTIFTCTVFIPIGEEIIIERETIDFKL